MADENSETQLPTETQEAPPASPSPSQQAPPPAAALVAGGEVTDETVMKLRRDLESAEFRARKAEQDAAYAQDEARRLKEVQIQAAGQLRQPSKRVVVGTGWFESEE